MCLPSFTQIIIDRRASRLPWDQRHLVHKLIRLHYHVVVHSFSSQTPSTNLMQLAWELLLALRLVVTSPTTLPCWPCHFALSCRLLLTNRALSRSYEPQQSTTFAAAVLLWTCIAHFVDVLAIVVTSHMPFHIVLAQSSPHCNAPTKLSQRTSPSTIVDHQLPVGGIS